MSFNSTHTGIPIAILAAAGVTSGEGLNQSNGVTGVLYNTETSVQSYTVPSTKTFNLQRIDIGGTLAAKFLVYLTPSGGSPEIIAVRRTSDKQPNDTIEFDTTDLAKQSFDAGDKLEVKVLHQNHLNGDFEARIQGMEIA